jgi:hypothetical protein
MEAVLSIFSLLECFTPTLNGVEQCIVALCLVHFTDRIKACIANIKQVTQETLHPVYNVRGPVQKFHHLLDSLDCIFNNRPGRILRSVSTAMLYHLAQTCKAFVLIASTPIIAASYELVHTQVIIAESFPDVVSGWWRHELDISDGPDDLGTWSDYDNGQIQRDAKNIYHWLLGYLHLPKIMKHPTVSALVHAILCRALLDGFWWVCIKACEVLQNVMPEPNGPFSVVALFGLVGLWLPLYCCGIVLKFLFRPNRVLASIPVILALASCHIPGALELDKSGVPVAFHAHMTWFGWVYYSLTAFRILFCALRAVGMHRMARDLRQDARLRIAALRTNPDNDRDQLARYIRSEKMYYRSYNYGAACFAWHAMTLLRVMEHGPSLQSPCLTWLTWGFGGSIRLIIIHSHLSYGEWLG